MVVVTATPALTRHCLLKLELILIIAFGSRKLFGLLHAVQRTRAYANPSVLSIKFVVGQSSISCSLPKQSCQTTSGSKLCTRACFTLVEDQRGKSALKYAPKGFWYTWNESHCPPWATGLESLDYKITPKITKAMQHLRKAIRINRSRTKHFSLFTFSHRN